MNSLNNTKKIKNYLQITISFKSKNIWKQKHYIKNLVNFQTKWKCNKILENIWKENLLKTNFNNLIIAKKN